MTHITRNNFLLLIGLLVAVPIVAADAQDQAKAATGVPADSVTRQRYRIGGLDAAFTATAGTLPLNDAKGERQASMFYVAYTRDGAPREQRPITFVFNGGPGASSAYLHIGALGPRIVDFGPDGQVPSPPGRLVDNPNHWLDLTDLVFVDPVGTGYSRPVAAGEDAYKKYWGVKEDLQALADFIELYLIRNNRQISPKYLVGESYGGFRAARLTHLLSSERGIGLAGVFLISPILEFRLATGDDFAPLPYAMRLPSYAAVTFERSKSATPEALAEVERFALGPYLAALAGSSRNESELRGVYAAVAKYTGLSEALVAQLGGRIPLDVFVKEARRSEKLVVSPYDGTASAPDPSPSAPYTRGDPVLDGLRTILTNTVADYLGDKLGVRTELPYRLANGETARQWNWWSGLFGQGGYPGAGDELRDALAANRGLKVMIAHGMTDLVTPYFASRYVIDHLPPAVVGERVTLNLYPGGHMMFLRSASRARLHADAAKLYPPPPK